MSKTLLDKLEEERIIALKEKETIMASFAEQAIRVVEKAKRKYQKNETS